LDQLARQRRESLESPLGIAVLDEDRVAFDVSEITKPTAKCVDPGRRG
jgi:hypothetical protein